MPSEIKQQQGKIRKLMVGAYIDERNIIRSVSKKTPMSLGEMATLILESEIALNKIKKEYEKYSQFEIGNEN